MGASVYISDRVTVQKLDDEQQLVGGWAYVTRDQRGDLVPSEHRDSEGYVTDHSGDRIDVYEVEKALHAYVSESRAGKDMHSGERVAECVGAITFTPEVKKALRLPDDYPEGGFIIHKIRDRSVWEKVKRGERAMLSISGSAVTE